MAINLSDLTGASTSANILAEVQSTADFLDSVPLLKNLADPSGATDAKQSVALNQPKALPLIKNPSGDLGGYLYIPDVSGNYATGPSVTIGANETWEAEVDMVIDQFGNYIQPMGGGVYFTGFGLLLYEDVSIRLFSKYWADKQSITGITLNKPFNLTYGYDGTDLYANIDGNRVYTTVAPSQSSSITHTLEIAHRALNHQGNYAIQKAKLTVNSAVVFDCDFNGSTSIRHGDTKFQAAVGGPVTINQSGNDPATVIKKPVLRFDGVDDFMDGVFNQTITGGYMFAAFSVLGYGGENSGRVFSVNSTSQVDYNNGGVIFSGQNGASDRLAQFNGGWRANHVGLFEDDNGDILHESFIESGNQVSRVNNADEASSSITYTISAEEFNIGGDHNGNGNPSIDLEYLALFDATITDSQADAVRSYINTRNNVFYRWDTDGYYFYNPQDLSSGAVTTWNGRIVGSDNGDADKNATQSTSADQPTSDGYKVTFADNTDHFDIPSTTQAGWQVVGTSLGTFAYKVNANAVLELNLLGNLGNESYRFSGDLYGIILLPESATSSEINEAKKLFTDRGASVSATGSVQDAWRDRADIVQFDGGDMSGVTNAYRAWRICTSLTSFSTELPSVTDAGYAWQVCTSLESFSSELPSANSVRYAWYSCNSLSDFRTTDIKNCSNFSNAWQGTTALTSFPADAKLGTEASNVNFSSAWRSSGLTSFSTALPSATDVSQAWRDCSSLTSFSSDLSLATGVSSAWRDCSSLESFSTALPSATSASYAWYRCTSLTSFSSTLPSVTNLYQAWQGCTSLTDFSSDVFSNWNPSSISSGVFDTAWVNCPLTAQSVENILTSIDSSGKYATTTGLSGGTALADAGIDIDYNGDPLSAATTAAIDSLSGKGWQVYINGELVIPNILDLQPAAAYSLRSFDADADPNVVNVRRSSDGATSDFTASEVSDGTLTSWVGAGNDGHVTTWYDQKIINETGDAYGTTISGTADGTSEYHLNLAPAVAGEYYRVRYTLSNLNPRGRVRFRNAADNAGLTAVAGTAAFSYINTDGSYETVVPSDDGLSLWFTADAGQSFDYSGISVQQVDNYQNNSSQTTASAQPLIVENGVLVTDGSGNPAMIGDDVDDTLFHPTLTQSLDNTDFLVTAAYEDELAMGITGAVPRLYLTNSSMSYNTLGTVSYPTQVGRNVISFQVAGNTQEVFGNGTSLATAAETQVDIGQSMFNVLRAGSGFSSGPLMEVVVFDENQVANRAAIETNINDHFDIY